MGHQRTLIVGAIYKQEMTRLIFNQLQLIAALKHCVEQHPILGAVITDGSSEKPGLALLETIYLEDHIDMRGFREQATEDQRIEALLAEISDEQFASVDKIPPWKVVLRSLPSERELDSTARFLILFAYYHSHGDGKSGLAFHRTFLEGLRNADPSTYVPIASWRDLFICKTSSAGLPPPMEEAGKLTLSWSYLLSPLLGAYLPGFLASMLGVRASAVAQDGGIWCGKNLSFDPSSFKTGLVMVTIDHNTMQAILQRCKARHVSFTGLLTHLIARAISSTLGPDNSSKAFASQIVVDLRRLFNGTYSDNTMMNCVSAYNETIPAPSTSADWTNPANEIWTAARNTTAEVAKSASTLHNQPIGLLQYLNDFRSWTLGQIGKKRECSFEISNLVVFDTPTLSTDDAKEPPIPVEALQIERTIFSQPANATGACLDFNLVSTKGGPLVITATWQRGVLDVGDGEQEEGFVRRICELVSGDVHELASVPL